MVIKKEYDPVKIEQDVKEKMEKQFPPSIKLTFPQHYPPFRWLSVDGEGRIFVMTWEKTENKKTFCDIFNSHGKYIAKVPLDIVPMIWKKDNLYTLTTNEDGYQVVKRYKVTWSI